MIARIKFWIEHRRLKRSVVPVARRGFDGHRKHAVETAGYWFSAARDAQDRGEMAVALLCMENAYNHAENAFVAKHASVVKLAGEALRHRINARLDSHLSEMKEGYDDSVTGFNEAWDVVRKVFDEKDNAPCP